MTKLNVRAFKKQVADLGDLVLTGSLLAIDPGSRSLGWAWFQGGEYMVSGTYKASSRTKPHERLCQIMEQLQNWANPDVLAVEKMFKLNPSLIWSVGASIVTVKPVQLIEVPIPIWKSLVPSTYEKSDETDAIYIGKAVLHHAK